LWLHTNGNHGALRIARDFDFTQKPVPFSRQRFHIAWLFRRIPEHLPEARYCNVQAVVEIDKSLIGPELPPEFFASDQFAWALDQRKEHPAGLIGQPKANAVLAKLASLRVQLERAEAEELARGVHRMHGRILSRGV
jgi:hypothetical protein